MTRGRLSVVATPIGNLEDITLRALRTLREADCVLAEDTRRTRVLLTHHAISARLKALHAHSPPSLLPSILRLLEEGQQLALVSDAGTPLLSDPGGELVRLASEQGFTVEVIPGASAVTAALVASGVPFASFRFAGFVPRGARERRELFERIGQDPDATVLFESPRRLHATLAELAGALAPERTLAICRELTKLHEEVARGTAKQLADRFAGEARGEITLVIGAGPATAERVSSEPIPLETRGAELLAKGLSTKDAARVLARERGLSRREVYAALNALSNARAR